MNQRTLLAACLLISGALAGCQESTESHGPPASLVAVGSASIAVTAGAASADSLAVKVVDAKGRAVPNVPVAWSVDGTGSQVTLTPATGTTNGSGIVRTSITGGTQAGTGTVRATMSVDGVAHSIPFTVTVNPGAATSLQAPPTVVVGMGATRTVTLSGRDQYGNAVTPSGVVWTTNNAGVAEVNSSGAITTRGLGGAQLTAQLGTITAATTVYVVPPTIRGCETNTATLCADWVLADSVYTATWAQGSTAVIRVGRFGADSVRFDRVDPAGTSQGMKAVYRGVPVNRAVQNGMVTWTHPQGYSFSGIWNATW